MSLSSLETTLLAAFLASVVELGDHWLAWILAPINSVGSVLVVGVKAIRMVRKKALGLPYAG